MKATIVQIPDWINKSFMLIQFMGGVQDGENEHYFLLFSTINKESGKVINGLMFIVTRGSTCWINWPEDVTKITAEITMSDGTRFKQTWQSEDARRNNFDEGSRSSYNFNEQFFLPIENGHPNFEVDITFEH